MTADTRVFLKKGDILRLTEEQGTGQAVICEIQKKIKESTCCICYHAVCDGKEGILKEFYPMDQKGEEQDFYFLKRTATHQLTASGEAMQHRFKNRCEDFAQGYRLLEKDKKEKKEREELPVYKVLYGEGNDKNQTSVYIWKEKKHKEESLEEYLEQERNRSDTALEEKVKTFLIMMYSLADAIRELHSKGLLHLDLQPSNIGIRSKNGVIKENSWENRTADGWMDADPYSVYLMDANAFYKVGSMYTKQSDISCYAAPETKKSRGENRSDIYSIGSVLFYGLVSVKGMRCGIYKDKYYRYLEQLVKESELLCFDEMEPEEELTERLTDILKKCLAKKPEDRYPNCEELMEDLEDLIEYVEYL